MEFLIFFLIVVIIIIGVILTVSSLLYRWIRKKQLNKKWRLISLVPIFILGYLIYVAIYPSTNFYKEDFEQVTNMSFPEGGYIKYKTASYPDHFGDYTSSFLVTLNQNDLSKLENQIKNIGFEIKENKMLSKQLDYIENKVEGMHYSRQYVWESRSKYYVVGFLNDEESVIITKISW